MYCPKCGTTNPDDAQVCIACNHSFVGDAGVGSDMSAQPATNRIPAQPKTSGLAIASLVLGILGFVTCGITGIVGLILGIVALSKINKSQGCLRGNGLAIGGIVTAVVWGLFLPVVALLVAILMPALDRAKELSMRVQCGSHLSAIGKGIVMYQIDFDDQNPSELQVLIETEGMHIQQFLCPSSNDEEGDVSYIYRGADLTSEASGEMVIAYDKHENHDGECRNVLMADGAIRRCQEEEFRDLIARDNEVRREMNLPEKPADP